MKKLYEITQDFQLLSEMLEQDAISQEAFNDTVESIEGEFDAKVGNLLTMRAEAINRINAVKDEIKRYQVLLKAAESNKNFIENYLREQMAAMDKTKVEDPKTLRRVSLSAKGPDTLAKPSDLKWQHVPSKYWKSKDPSIDFAAIKKDLIEGTADETVSDNFSIVEGKRKLTIK